MKILKDILYGARITEVVGSTHIAVESVVADSRQVKPFGCFVAISGAVVDGHDHIPGAIRAGAAAVVCERLPAEADRIEQVVYIQVENARQALGHLAANFHDNPGERLKIVAVTGTNGKTTVVTLLHRLARLFDRKAGLVSTVENRIVDRVVPATHTTPDPVGLQKLFADMLDAGCTHCFMEASSHALDQHRLAGTPLTGGVFTNITHDHLDYHGDFNAYIAAKKSLFDGLPGTAFALTNADARHGDTMVQNTRARVVTYGTHQVADHKARIVENGLGGLQLHLDGQDLYTRLIGDFNAANLTAVYAVARELGWNGMDALTHLPAGRPRWADAAGPGRQRRRPRDCRLRPHTGRLAQGPRDPAGGARHWTRQRRPRRIPHPVRRGLWGRPGSDQAPRDGADRRRPRRPRHPHLRQPAERGPQRHPRRHARRPRPGPDAQGDRQCRSGRSHPHRLHASRPGRCHPCRRQGPREVPGNRREKHPFDDVAVLAESLTALPR